MKKRNLLFLAFMLLGFCSLQLSAQITEELEGKVYRIYSTKTSRLDPIQYLTYVPGGSDAKTFTSKAYSTLEGLNQAFTIKLKEGSENLYYFRALGATKEEIVGEEENQTVNTIEMYLRFDGNNNFRIRKLEETTCIEVTPNSNSEGSYYFRGETIQRALKIYENDINSDKSLTTSIEDCQIFIEEIPLNELLQDLINQSAGLKLSTVVGTGNGQYPQDKRDQLDNATNNANTIKANPAATINDYIKAHQILSAAIAEYIDSKISEGSSIDNPADFTQYLSTGIDDPNPKLYRMGDVRNGGSYSKICYENEAGEGKAVGKKPTDGGTISTGVVPGDKSQLWMFVKDEEKSDEENLYIRIVNSNSQKVLTTNTSKPIILAEFDATQTNQLFKVTYDQTVSENVSTNWTGRPLYDFRSYNESSKGLAVDGENMIVQGRNATNGQYSIYVAAVEHANDLDISLWKPLLEKAKYLHSTTVAKTDFPNVITQNEIDELGSSITEITAIVNNAENQETINEQIEKLSILVTEFEGKLKKDFSELLELAQYLLAESEEGTENGQYPVGSKEELSNAIDIIDVVINGENVAQSQYNTAYDFLKTATDKFNASVIGGINKDALIGKINEADEIFENSEIGEAAGQHTQEGMDAFQAAIEKAKVVRDDADAYQISINKALNELVEAIAEFERDATTVTFDALIAATEKAETFTTDVIAAEGSDLKTALDETLALIATSKKMYTEDMNSVTQAQIDEAANNMTTKTNEFIYALKANLRSLLATAELIIATVQTTPESDIATNLAELKDAINVTKQCLNQELTQIEIKDYENLLEERINTIKDLLAAPLAELITTAENELENAGEEYSTEAKAALEEAVKTAKAVLEEENLDYSSAEISLRAAIKQFLTSPVADLIKEAETLHNQAVEGVKAGEYPTGSKTLLLTAINAAKAEIAKAEPDYNLALNELKEAVEKFKKSVNIQTGLDELSVNNIAIYSANNRLYITGLTEQVNINAYDMQGKMIFSELSGVETYSKDMPSGMYIITIQGYVNGNSTVIIR